MGAGTITVKDDPRVLPLGHWLRLSKINELPQLINVIKGEMSIIGPRPHAERDLVGVPLDKLRTVQSVKPGVSGIASIIFRSEDKIIHEQSDGRRFYDEVIAPYKASLDCWYVQRRSIRLYTQLILLTIVVVLSGRVRFLFKIFSDLPTPPEELAFYLLPR
jgi:lipopolysaccharide/colanic/teichoic acid biosynthesis glycosyltransferase